jgi:hypothetical protein
MKKIFTQEELELLKEALQSQVTEIEMNIIEAEDNDSPDSVIFAYSKDFAASKIMKQFIENVMEQDDCLFAEGCSDDVAIALSGFTERKD